MIERVVLIKLKPEYVADATRVAADSEAVLRTAPGVRSMHAGPGVGRRTTERWDLGLVLRFDDMDAVQRYRAHPIHRKYLEVYLRPMLDAIEVYNFESTAK